MELVYNVVGYINVTILQLNIKLVVINYYSTSALWIYDGSYLTIIP